MVKRVLLCVAVLCVLAVGAQGQILFTASMTGDQESPPITTGAQGTAWVLLSPDMSSLTYRLTFARLESTATGAHFHTGAPGVAGPVVHPITLSGNTASGTWSNLPDSILQRLFKGELYLNVHSAKNPGGEVRGQLMLSSGMGFTMSLDGSQEVPAVTTPATGTGYAYLDSVGSGLVFRVTIAGLKDTLSGSHFHTGAPGVAGPVVFPAPFTDSTSSGTWTGFADSIYGKLPRSGLYFNVHSKTHPGGEIRGQLSSATGVHFTAAVDSSQEVPPTRSRGQATFWGVLSPDGALFTYRATYAHLESTFAASHFHAGAPGVNGPVLVPITFAGNTANASVLPPPDSVMRLLLTGGIYVNIHSAMFPGGEIRGQVVTMRGLPFIMGLNTAQEGTPGGPASGTGYGVLDSTGRRLSHRVTIAGLSDTLTGSHFHSAPPGVAGPVVRPTSFLDSTSTGVWTGFADSLLSGMVQGRLYFNVHTRAKPGGEIRGQMVYMPSSLTAIRQVSSLVPVDFSLEQNYPNPFNPSTTIQFSLAVPGQVSLKVYNLIGQEVATLVNETRTAGTYQVSFNAGALASGVYFYRLSGAGGRVESRKMMLVK